ncbi:membrane protein of unknown function [Candidatus Hydrogenisulfobacillus filiaventi]|uniref:Uncharacterized protein n=1 Tax=Candidatus Hydrogenisulfobacillus filiaventi TaxID=2707344 RepID=A0A6F8ZF75_9FIRM|nr:membrane protein of unknown function [Candidatus Hydrogenisulfobacillus filiaventi]
MAATVGRRIRQAAAQGATDLAWAVATLTGWVPHPPRRAGPGTLLWFPVLGAMLGLVWEGLARRSPWSGLVTAALAWGVEALATRGRSWSGWAAGFAGRAPGVAAAATSLGVVAAVAAWAGARHLAGIPFAAATGGYGAMAVSLEWLPPPVPGQAARWLGRTRRPWAGSAAGLLALALTLVAGGAGAAVWTWVGLAAGVAGSWAAAWRRGGLDGSALRTGGLVAMMTVLLGAGL